MIPGSIEEIKKIDITLEVSSKMRNREKFRRKICKICQKKYARFQYRGQIKWDRKHDLCFRCWRSMLDAMTFQMNAPHRGISIQ